MKTKITKINDQFTVTVPSEFIERLNLKEDDPINIDLNLDLTQIIIGKCSEQTIEDIEADEDF